MASATCDLVCFGELLWDILPAGKVAGGAPFNIVNRATALGLNAHLISSVGKDAPGDELLANVQLLNNSIVNIQRHPFLPTSFVTVHVGDNGEPAYTIVRPVAWDDIRLTDSLTRLVRHTRAFVYSSLALRDERTRRTLFALLPDADLRICDVNLRADNYEKSVILEMIESADILRMNEDELAQISTWLGTEDLDLEDQVKRLAEKYNYRLVIITLGAAGAVCYDREKWHRQPVFKVKVKDTVGSGDAFLAGFIYRYLKGDSPPQCLKFACAVGALTASRPGGTPLITLQDIHRLMNS